MDSVSTVGKGYFNYYHVKSRTDYTDGKARTAWYDRDLTKEEICSNNVTLNREYAGADLCRKVASAYEGIAEANRAKYSTAREATDAIWAKYTATREYSAYSHEERVAMARNELNMTLYGTVQLGDVHNDPHLKGEVTKNKLGNDEKNDREFNVKTLEKQIMNVLEKFGVNPSVVNSNSFIFSIDSKTKKVAVSFLDNKDGADELINLLQDALNSKNNAEKLFNNLLCDANKQGLLPKDALTKYKLYSDFYDITGLDIDDFRQTKEGFVDDDGVEAKEIFKEALKSTTRVPTEFKGAAYEYFVQLETQAAEYDISKVSVLNVSMEYRNGYVHLNGDQKHIDYSV